MKILLVEDDEQIVKSVEFFLARNHINVDSTDSCKGALALINRNNYDVYILDRMLKDGYGDSVLKTLRAKNITNPVIMLTALSELEDKVKVLGLGADDYMTKPFHLPELLARIKALQRRSANGYSENNFSVQDLTIDFNSCRVFINTNEVFLSPRLYALLEYLALKKDTVCTREELLENIWDLQDDSGGNTVDVHIKYLRDKIDNDRDIKLIRTIKNRGYSLCTK